MEVGPEEEELRLAYYRRRGSHRIHGHNMALQVTYRYKVQKPDAVQRREEGIRTLKNYPSKVPVSWVTRRFM